MMRTITLLLVLSTLRGDAAESPHSLIVAHRGLLSHAPENTLANFRACLGLRLGFEFDVERTKDGHLVCIHDSTVDRTTNGTGKVSELTLAQIRAFDAGSWFDPKFTGEKVPTVDEVLQLVARDRQQDVLIAVDLKSENVGEDVVRLAEKLKVLDRLLFIGRTITEPKLREQIKDASAKAHTAAVANNAEEFPEALAAPNADWVYVRFLPSKDQIEAVHQAKKRAFIAGPTVSGNLPHNWQHAASVGLDAILTDYPLELRVRLKTKDEQDSTDDLNGTWNFVYYEEKGVVQEPGTKQFVITGNRLDFRVAGQTHIETAIELKDGSLDQKFKDGQVYRSIFKRVGNLLILCGNRDKERPTKFLGGTETGGEFFIVVKLASSKE